MASLKDLKNRIKSVKSTQKITKAMKMVAAAKLRRAQERAEQSRPYTEKLGAIIASLTSGGVSVDGRSLIAGTGKDKTHLVVVATSSRGLCGGFNSSIGKAALLKINALINEGKTVKILCIGRKGYDFIKRLHKDKIIDKLEIETKQVEYAFAAQVSQKVIALFEAGEFDVCTIFYNKFISAITQKVTEKQLIPLEMPEVAGASESYDFEPEEEKILESLLPKNLAVQIYSGLLENYASEQGARMSAMDNATRNAGEMIKKLTLQYNRSRQASITKELIEIISGAEAI